MRVGKKHPQPIKAASLLSFDWRPATRSADYFGVQMHAANGPMDTSDYRLVAEAVPLDERRTFLHMAYSFSYGGSGAVAMRLYLATVGHDKVGFTPLAAGVRDVNSAGGEYVGGMRGVVERNTMRYYLAIESYLGSLKAPKDKQLDKRLVAWFEATEEYPRQLRELDRDEYLNMKRSEARRQVETR